MIWIALSLGFLGSLHCVGMCGPLAIMACKNETSSDIQSAFKYNFGRVSTYILLGVFFGFVGKLLWMASLQKAVAIVSGIILIFLFFRSMNIDEVIWKSKFGGWLYRKVQSLIQKFLSSEIRHSVFLFGMLNGLIPCGLVYLALAGALASEGVFQAGVFMLFFGMGTLPAMIGTVTGYQLMTINWKKRFNKILPTVSLCFGFFLIYRGLFIDVPLELNFWEALKNPIMCH